MKKIKSFIFTAIALAALFSFTSCWFFKDKDDDEETKTNNTSGISADDLVLEEGTYDLTRVVSYSWEGAGDYSYTEYIKVTVSGDSVTEVTFSTIEGYTDEATYKEDKENLGNNSLYTYDDEKFTITYTYDETEKTDSTQTFTLAEYKASLFATTGSTSTKDIEYSNVKVEQSEDKKTITRTANAAEYDKGKSSANGDTPTNTYSSVWTYTK